MGSPEIPDSSQIDIDDLYDARSLVSSDVADASTSSSFAQDASIPDVYASEPRILDIADLYPPKKLAKEFNPTEHLFQTAKQIATLIVWFFGITIVGTVIANFALLFHLANGKLQDSEDFVTKAVIPLITSVSTFGATLFGPLLAFVLGYYFGEGKSTSPSTSGDTRMETKSS